MVPFLLPVFAAAGDEPVPISASAPRKSSVSVSDSDSTGETVSTAIDEADGGGVEGGEPPELSQSRGLGVTFGEGSGFDMLLLLFDVPADLIFHFFVLFVCDLE